MAVVASFGRRENPHWGIAQIREMALLTEALEKRIWVSEGLTLVCDLGSTTRPE